MPLGQPVLACHWLYFFSAKAVFPCDAMWNFSSVKAPTAVDSHPTRRAISAIRHKIVIINKNAPSVQKSATVVDLFVELEFQSSKHMSGRLEANEWCEMAREMTI